MNDFLGLLSLPIFEIAARAIFVAIVFNQFGDFLLASIKLIWKTRSIKALGKHTLKFVLILVGLILGFGLGLTGLIRLGIDAWNIVFPFIVQIWNWIWNGGGR